MSSTGSTLLLYLRLLGGLVLEEDGEPLSGRAAQKRRLALLALLATARERALSRARITGLIWPDKDDEQARHLLSVAGYEIRKELGEDAIVSRGDDVVLDPLVVRSDVEDFEAAIERGEHDAAIELYRGPFLDGFVLGGSVDFEHWIDQERSRFERLYKQALTARAEALEKAGDPVAAADAWRRAANADRFDSRIALRLLAALDAAGNRAGALQFARIHEALVRQEFGTDPDPAFAAAVEKVRSRTEPAAPPKEEAPPPAPGRPPAEPAVAAAAAPPDGGGSILPKVMMGAASRGVLIVAALLVVAVVVGMMFDPWGPSSEPTTPTRDVLRVAVLPFDAADSADVSFADGLSENILTALAGVDGIEVQAWSAVAALRDVDLRTATTQLDVDYILEGSVHRDGTRLRIPVRLARGGDGGTQWSASFDREAGQDFVTWDEIARAVLDTIPGHLGARPLVGILGASDNEHAQARFYKGLAAWNMRMPTSLAQAYSYFRQALEIDPEYPRAYAGIANVYNIMGAYDYGVMRPDSAYALALANAQEALRLEPDLGEAHAARASVLFNHYRAWEAADSAFRKAISLYPHYAEAHHWYSIFLLARGEREASRQRVQRAFELDSLSAVMRSSLARNHYFRGDMDRSLELYLDVLEDDPSFMTALNGAGTVYLELDRIEDAVEAFKRSVDQTGGVQPLPLALLGHAQARAGRADSARAILARLEAARDAGRWVSPEAFFLIHVGLGQEDAAIDYLEMALESGSNSGPFFGIDPLVKPLWDNQRFIELRLIERGRQPRPRPTDS